VRQIYIMKTIIIIQFTAALAAFAQTSDPANGARPDSALHRETRASANSAVRSANSSQSLVTAVASGWGEPVEGVSVRLQVDKTFWELPAMPILRASVRNQGREILLTAQTQQPGELEVDGVWYSWWNPYQVTRKPLAPGESFGNIPVTLNATWRQGLTTLVSVAGKHRLRFAVVAKRTESSPGPGIRAVSNPVDVELRWPAATLAAMASQTNASAAALAAYPWPVGAEKRAVRLKRGDVLRGVVVDHAGQPVAGARVYLAGAQRFELLNGAFQGTSATTDAAGRFTLTAEGRGAEKVVVAASEGQMISVTPISTAGRKLRITLPQPGVMIVRYDIADDLPEAQLRIELMTQELDAPAWRYVNSTLEPTVPNQGQIVLTNLSPGTYDFARTKPLSTGTGAGRVPYERCTVVIEAGQTQRVDLVRSAGFPIYGTVTGMADTGAPGAYIYVRSVEATGELGKDFNLPLFDEMTCARDGGFHTARLLPGTYMVTVEAYAPPAPLPPHSRNVETTAIRVPSHLGSAKVTVTADSAPAPVKIELRPRP
jgi:hypothetical protein